MIFLSSLVLLVATAATNANSINRPSADSIKDSLVNVPVEIVNAVESTVQNVVDVGREAIYSTHTITRDVVKEGKNVVNKALGAVKGVTSVVPGVSQVVGGTAGFLQDQISTVNVAGQALLHSTHDLTDRALEGFQSILSFMKLNP